MRKILRKTKIHGTRLNYLSLTYCDFVDIVYSTIKFTKV